MTNPGYLVPPSNTSALTPVEGVADGQALRFGQPSRPGSDQAPRDVGSSVGFRA
jgi:hypothetical protein